MPSASTSIKLSDEKYSEKMTKCMDDCLGILINDNNNKHCAVVVFYDFEKEESIFAIVEPRGLCMWVFGILKETKEYYDANLDCQIEMDTLQMKGRPNVNLLSWGYKNSFTDYERAVKFRFATKDKDTLLTINSLLSMCEDKKDLNKLLQNIENEDDMWDCYQYVFMKNFDKSGKNEMVKKQETPREETPREEIPREKTLSKKEKEKLKKQKAKDKAKLAEQQAKQFEKQQKERERKRIETARKKKLALLKK
jgi:hypothetical protein